MPICHVNWESKIEPITKNIARTVHWSSLKTHCPQGHSYDEANTYHWKGKRLRKACRRNSLREHYDPVKRKLWRESRKVIG